MLRNASKHPFSLSNYALFLENAKAPPAHTIAPKTAIIITGDEPVFGDVVPAALEAAPLTKKATGDKELNVAVTVPSLFTLTGKLSHAFFSVSK